MSKYPVDISEEIFELVTVFDIPMLFTCARADRTTLPSGMYLYEVRHDDDGKGEPCEIAESILVNHWGTVVTNQPIILNKEFPHLKPFKIIDSENDWNYEGIYMSVNEYKDKYKPTLNGDK